MYNKRNTTKFQGVCTPIIISIILIFFCISIVNLNGVKDKLQFPYKYILNMGMPILKSNSNIDDESSFSKNTIYNLLGLSKINSSSIINNEVSFFNIGTKNICEAGLDIKPFDINDEAITKITADGIADDSLKKNLDSSKPEVLIYHTHTLEGFEGGGMDTSDEKYNIVGIGDILAKELEETYGISVVHNKTNHCISYNKSYARSYETLKKYVDEYKGFKLIIDLHRDAANSKAATTLNINGVNVGKISFVSSKASPYYNDNKAFFEAMVNKSNELFPGLASIKKPFNHGLCEPHQSIQKNSLLIECGSNLNTPEEAAESAKIIARLIAEQLNK